MRCLVGSECVGHTVHGIQPQIGCIGSLDNSAKLSSWPWIQKKAWSHAVHPRWVGHLRRGLEGFSKCMQKFGLGDGEVWGRANLINIDTLNTMGQAQTSAQDTPGVTSHIWKSQSLHPGVGCVCERFLKFANGVIWCCTGLFATKTEEWVLRTGPWILPLLEHSIGGGLSGVGRKSLFPRHFMPKKSLKKFGACGAKSLLHFGSLAQNFRTVSHPPGEGVSSHEALARWGCGVAPSHFLRGRDRCDT